MARRTLLVAGVFGFFIRRNWSVMNPNAMSTKKRLDSRSVMTATEPQPIKRNHAHQSLAMRRAGNDCPVLTPFILMLTGIAATGLGWQRFDSFLRSVHSRDE